MPDQDNTNTTTQPIVQPTTADDNVAIATTQPITEPSDTVVPPEPIIDPVVTADSATETAPATQDNNKIMSEVATKISESHNILVALSSDPSVDEMSAAIGLSLFLDRLGKRVTAIYSGATPNALEFLNPEETFEKTADTLQDFVIALNKDKADHLRYKLDGDYVKIFITPYRSRISSDDLEFSYGDFNVDLVLALDVANGVDLDAALREHGRIMHDATVVNITTGNPGKLGEIEWSDKTASSVSEMVAELLYAMSSKEKVEKEEATAFLTGIVAATNRFSSASTTPRTMSLASKLMESGANQQLVSKNITPDIENEFFNLNMVEERKDNDPTKLDIEHGNEHDVEEDKEVDTVVTEKESSLLEDLKAAEASLANAAAEVTPEVVNEPVRLDEPETIAAPNPVEATLPDITTPASEPRESAGTALVEEPATTSEPQIPGSDIRAEVKSEKVIEPSAGFVSEPINENKYGQMLEDALADSGPAVGSAAIISNPATSIAPPVANAPEVNSVPEINYMPLPGEEVLPPPPTPPIDFSSVNTPDQQVEPEQPRQPVMPSENATPQPAMQDQVYSQQAANPAAFKIPGT